MFRRTLPILTATLLLVGCGEAPQIRSYETTGPAGFVWPDTPTREAGVELGELAWVWDVPAGWMDAPEVADQLLADYRFEGATQSLPGRVTVSKLDGDAGGVNANVMRWLNQIYVTNVTGLGPRDKVSPTMSLGFADLTFVELHGQYQGEHVPTRLSAAIVQIPAQGGGVFQTWTFKLAADEATLQDGRHQWDLAQMVLSFRPKDAPRPDLPSLEELRAMEDLGEGLNGGDAADPADPIGGDAE